MILSLAEAANVNGLAIFEMLSAHFLTFSEFAKTVVLFMMDNMVNIAQKVLTLFCI